MYNEETKLYYHGYDSSKEVFWADKTTGLSKNFWLRAIGWFIVSIVLPTGIVDNHYELKYWDLFKCKEVEKEPYKYDGHTPEDVKERMHKFIKEE